MNENTNNTQKQEHHKTVKTHEKQQTQAQQHNNETKQHKQ